MNQESSTVVSEKSRVHVQNQMGTTVVDIQQEHRNVCLYLSHTYDSYMMKIKECFLVSHFQCVLIMHYVANLIEVNQFL